ncbi:VanW family protein [Thermoactinomyces sp. DSM 45892]|uniref:VanW family protein n=1 Tax=Thermoactinomyces sp. DSM 45892 TaxID=1882753 RepID=UPI00089AA84A|nr:VanW family protein [Thermoactinomyces sp. DSM 45892]SDZ26522.1 Putative peptidoglycan binding domain-containing protein [Thermoactinomyces sp. DSM 45892]
MQEKDKDKEKREPDRLDQEDTGNSEATEKESDSFLVLEENSEVPLSDTSKWNFTELEKVLEEQGELAQDESEAHAEIEPSATSEEMKQDTELQDIKQTKHDASRLASDSEESQESEVDEDSFLQNLHQETRSTLLTNEEELVDSKKEEDLSTKNLDSEKRSAKKTKKWFVSALAFLFVLGAVYLWVTQDASNNPRASEEKVKVPPQKITLTAKGKNFELDLRTIGYDGKDATKIDQKKLAAWLDDVKKQVDIPMKNASQKKVGTPITPEQAGSVVDVQTVQEWLTDIKSMVNQTKELPFITVEPQVTTKDIEKASSKLVGSFKTTFDPGNENRTINIKKSSETIDGLVLLPGEEFSFNKVVGERTVARGYKKAGVIVKGELAEDIGGGICQVSSTLFNSVDRAKVQITRRISHSKEVPYVPPGRDATVSWGGPDFRFKNSYNKPMVIRITVSGGTIQINTYTAPGAERGKTQPLPPEKFSKSTDSGAKSEKDRSEKETKTP